MRLIEDVGGEAAAEEDVLEAVAQHAFGWWSQLRRLRAGTRQNMAVFL
jgi:hypothetical protein